MSQSDMYSGSGKKSGLFSLLVVWECLWLSFTILDFMVTWESQMLVVIFDTALLKSNWVKEYLVHR